MYTGVFDFELTHSEDALHSASSTRIISSCGKRSIMKIAMNNTIAIIVFLSGRLRIFLIVIERVYQTYYESERTDSSKLRNGSITAKNIYPNVSYADAIVY
jgi:hypothetical protein